MKRADDLFPDLKVFVKSADGSEIASKLSGYFVLNGHKFPFSAIAFGRIGGHNASVTLTKSTLKALTDQGVNADDVQLSIQRKLVEGDIVLPEGLEPPS